MLDCPSYTYRNETWYSFSCVADACYEPNSYLNTEGTCECSDYYYRNETVDYYDFANACTQDPCSDASYLYIDGTCCED